uniref:Calcineurin-like phosphoesterase domain-containing protein n=1 Tax=Haptolina ericina TaxID=156174 RepID=A0A7S3ARR8_9EUKA
MFNVGSFVLIDGTHPGMLAVDNGDGTWDLIMNDETDLNGVPSSRLQLRSSQSERHECNGRSHVQHTPPMPCASALIAAHKNLQKVDSVVTAYDGSRTEEDLREGKVKRLLPAHSVAFLQSELKWEPVEREARVGRKEARLHGPSTLVVFDFDCTLTICHMYALLRTREGAHALANDPGHFYEEVFGGEARIQKLRDFLCALERAGATLAVLSNGLGREIRAALRFVGLKFWKVLASEEQKAASATKPMMLARLAQQASGEFEAILFVDDDRDNYPSPREAAGVLVGSRWRLDKSATILLAYPAGACVESDGLDGDAMEALLQQFATPLSASPEAVPRAAFSHVNDPTRAWDVVRSVQAAVELPKVRFTDPGPKPEGAIRFVCVSDTHGRALRDVQMPEGDVLLHAGDFSMTGRPEEVSAFAAWLSSQPYRRKIVIAGNHDLTFDEASYAQTYSRFGHPRQFDTSACRKMLEEAEGVEYLYDSSTSVDGVTVYGSPWQPEFGSWAFNLERGEPCRQRWQQIPSEADVVVTHGPALGHGDLCSSRKRAGCLDLLHELQTRVRPLFHVCGHIHEAYGVTTDGMTTYVNASTCNLRYRPDNKPLCFDVMPPRRGGCSS